MTRKISSRLTDNLQSDVVPRLSRNLVSSEEILKRFVELLEVQNSRIGVILAGEDCWEFGRSVVVDQRVRWCIPSTATIRESVTANDGREIERTSKDRIHLRKR